MTMNFMLLLLLIASIHWASADIPEECKPQNYKELVDQFRVPEFMSDVKITKSDFLLKTGWYRFNVVAKRMIERSELKQTTNFGNSKKFRPCGTNMNQFGLSFNIQNALLTSPFYALDEPHPTTKYGQIITNVVACRYQAVIVASINYKHLTTCDVQNAKNCSWTLQCTSKNENINVAVRNCDGFYVYFLRSPNKQIPQGRYPFSYIQKEAIYCGTKTVEPPKVEGNPQCQNYRGVYDPTRAWEHMGVLKESPLCNDDIDLNKDKSFFHNAWTRFYNSSVDEKTMMLSDRCETVSKSYDTLNESISCNALYRGWVLGGHPKKDEGVVERRLCFSDQISCKCQMSSAISIVNCGHFYLYRRRDPGFPHCYARACTIPDPRSQESVTTTTTTTTNTTTTTSERKLQPSPAMSEMINSTSPMISDYMKTNASGMMMTKSILPFHSRSYSLSINSTADMMMAKIMMSHNLSMMSSTTATPAMTSQNIRSTLLMSVNMSAISPSSATIDRSSSTSVVSPKSSMMTSLHGMKEKLALNLCNNSYKTVIDDTRVVSFTRSFTGCDKHFFPAVRFQTSKGEDLQLLEGCQKNDQLSRSCSITSNVWLQGRHPGDGKFPQVMVLCKNVANTQRFPFDQGYCSCPRSQQQLILVQKCTSFYVYKLFPLFSNSGSVGERSCNLRYCMEKVPGTKPTERTTTVKANEKNEMFALNGSFQIITPFLNGAPLVPKDISDKNSKEYKFLKILAQKTLREALMNIKEVTTIEITGLRIGSLIVNYEMRGSEPIQRDQVERDIIKHFTQNPSIDISTMDGSFSGRVNASSNTLVSIDQCSLFKPCHSNATCMNNPVNNTFNCKCKPMYSGDGFECVKTVEVVRKVTELTTTVIIIIAVVAGVCLLIIIVLSACLCCRSSQSYSTSRSAFHRGGNLDNYYSTDAPSKDKTLTMPVAHNMYMTSEPADGTTTFSEKVHMNSIDKQNSHFIE